MKDLLQPGGANNAWLVRPAPKHAPAVRLFCVPSAGAGPSAFRGWAQAISADVEALYVHLPGRESRLRDANVPDVSRLADEIAQAIAPFTDQPFALFGHSLGALIAFEVAHRLRNDGAPSPVRLFASASRAPQLPYPFPRLHTLEEDQFLQQINERYDGSVPREVIEDAELRELVVPALRADFAALETYDHPAHAALDCPISVFGGSRDRTLDSRALEAWSVHSASGFHYRIVDGGHFFLQSARQQLIAAISEDLSAVPAPLLVAGV
jgi:medium-chain acyl-[acyl-carrier-protein] hydrolase